MDALLKSLGIEIPGLITQFLGFIVLAFLMAKYAFPPLLNIIDQRQADINSTYERMDTDRQRMEDTRRQYEERLAGIEAEARERIQAAVKEAQALRDNLVSDAQKQAESILEQGRNESERERQRAFLEMRQQVVALAVAAAGKVVGESLDNARHTKLVDDFITSVGTNGAGANTRNVSSDGMGAANGAMPV